MDGDLQDPPELIAPMVSLYRQGFDVVHARRTARRKESAFKRATAWLFYRLMRAATDSGIEANVGEFRLMSRPVVDALRGLRERHRLVRGLVSWVGFSHTTIEFERPGRAAGGTKYSVSRMLRLSLDAMTSFSAVPLRLATLLGFLGLLAGIGYAVYAVYIGYVRGLGVPGWTSLVILNIFFSGVVLVCLGLIGEYVGRIFEEVKRRPLYLVKRTLGASSRGEGSSEGAERT
jgi:dolichol-phosphate mannosyltransferase